MKNLNFNEYSRIKSEFFHKCILVQKIENSLAKFNYKNICNRERERVIPWDNQFLVLDSISYNKPIAGKEVIYGKLNCNFFFFFLLLIREAIRMKHKFRSE